ncbi:MAG: lipoyl(octanoyl) transferase LipB [Hydrogenophilaceae bacterium]|nr:lipoyl(octanoyl) transferase LipB [Hydrogenophilaceae bacterium]
MPPSLLIRRLGRVEYEPTWRAMQTFTAGRGPDTPDELWLLEHPPVFTLGQAGRREHLLTDIGVPVVAIDRGGQVTYHGPGQVVAYVLVDLRRRGYGVKELVRRLEQAVIDLLADYGVKAERLAGAPGVYVAIPEAPGTDTGESPRAARDPLCQGGHERLAKIAALGLRIRGGCSYHGVALNVDPDLAPFAAINPCGYEGMAVTRLTDLGIGLDVAGAGEALAQRLQALL